MRLGLVRYMYDYATSLNGDDMVKDFLSVNEKMFGEDDLKEPLKILFANKGLPEFEKKFCEAVQYAEKFIMEEIKKMQLRRYYPHYLNNGYDKCVLFSEPPFDKTMLNGGQNEDGD